MPWKCKTCGGDLGGTEADGPQMCAATPKCKAKAKYAAQANDASVCSSWEQGPAELVATKNDDVQARALGYGRRYNSNTENFPAGHKTNLLFVNDAFTHAISPDGSTHSGDRIGWKCFTKGPKGWTFAGERDVDLQPWPFRTRSAKLEPFPKW